MFNSSILKVLFIVTAVMIIGGATYAFAAANTFTTTPPSKIGDGQVDISGYDVSNVAYSFGADPANITAVDFDLSATAVTVKIQLVKTTGAIYDCVEGTSNHWSCDTTSPQATVPTTDVLRVIANDIVP